MRIAGFRILELRNSGCLQTNSQRRGDTESIVLRDSRCISVQYTDVSVYLGDCGSAGISVWCIWVSVGARRKDLVVRGADGVGGNIQVFVCTV